MTRVAVLGALGRMGREVCRAVSGDDELELAGAVDPKAMGYEEEQAATVAGVRVVGGVDELDVDSIDAMVDFTQGAAAVDNIKWALENGIDSVVGTTGIGEESISEIREMAQGFESNVLIAPNFAIGAVLMMRFCEQAAEVFDQCEIVELHHRGKKDAPSGTAMQTAMRIGSAMEGKVPATVGDELVDGSRGGSLGDVNIHSIRLDGLVAHQEVIFGARGQTLSIRHDTTDRSCFMTGVLLAVKRIGSMPGLTIGLEPVLELAFPGK